MLRVQSASVLGALAFALAAPIACSKEGASPGQPTDPCLLTDCSGDASAPPKKDASVVDAARPDAGPVGDSSPGTGVVAWDGFVPPPADSGTSVVPIRDAEWDPDGVSGPTGPINGGPLPESTSCGDGPVAFATHQLEVITQGPAAMPQAFATQWANAVARGGAPGPGLVLLADSGAVDGGTRRFRFGAPVASGAGFAFFAQPHNPLAALWSFTPASYVEAKQATTVNLNAAVLRFRTAAGSAVDVPVVDAAFQGAIRGASGDAGGCTALGNTAMWLVLPSAAGSIVLEGQTLASTLGAASVQQPSGVIGWTVRLFGTLPKVSFVGSVP
jgi:hypothetical protein